MVHPVPTTRRLPRAPIAHPRGPRGHDAHAAGDRTGRGAAAGGPRHRLAEQHRPGRARRLRGERGCPPRDLDPVEHLGRPRWPVSLLQGKRHLRLPGRPGSRPARPWRHATDLLAAHQPRRPGAGRFERYRNIIAGKHDRYIREWARAAKAFGKARHRAPGPRDERDVVPLVPDQLRQHRVGLPVGVAARREGVPQGRCQERHVPVEPLPALRNVQQLQLRAVLSGQPLCRLRRGLGPQLGGRRVDLPRRPRRRVPGRPATHHQDRSPVRRASP